MQETLMMLGQLVWALAVLATAVVLVALTHGAGVLVPFAGVLHAAGKVGPQGPPRRNPSPDELPDGPDAGSDT
jgi:hypothetical protein